MFVVLRRVTNKCNVVKVHFIIGDGTNRQHLHHPVGWYAIYIITVPGRYYRLFIITLDVIIVVRTLL